MIFIDLTQYIENRLNTGIQRVVNQYLRRAIKDSSEVLVLFCNKENKFSLLDNKEVLMFLDNVLTYKFQKFSQIDIFNISTSEKIFFDIDSVWNSSYPRELLYEQLKKENFKIYNFIYDLIPILFPEFLHEKTKKNFEPYIKAICKYSDKIFFDSKSAKNDFLKLQKSLSSISRPIETQVIYLGSDFKKNSSLPDNLYKDILAKKFILFVGTIEPRKQQRLLLEAFDDLYENYPDLNIVFIGAIGWNVEQFISTLYTHPLKDKNIFHYKDIDDTNLVNFYEKAFLVTYLSYYEGYGLPVVESLKYSNITIASYNSSIPEIGLDFVDYIFNNSKIQLVKKIGYYLENDYEYKKRKKIINKEYITPNWELFYINISKYFNLD